MLNGVVRFTRDVDFPVVAEDIPAISTVLTTFGYGKCAENAIFSRLKPSSLRVDDIDVMQVNRATVEKLLEESVIHHPGTSVLRVPSVPSLMALKLHTIRSIPDCLQKDGWDIADLLLRPPSRQAGIENPVC